MNAIGTHQLPPVITVDQIMVVLLDLPVLVRLLYTTSGGCIVTGNRQTNHGTIRQGNRFLYQTFTKGTATYDHAPVPILNSAGDDLAGRSRGLVHQHDQTSLLELSASGRVRLLTRLLTPFRINDQPVFIQELIRQLYGDIQISPAISLQIQNQVLHALFPELLQRLPEFIGGRSGETVQLNITGILIRHISGIQTIHGNLTANDLEIHQFRRLASLYFHTHLGTFRSA